MSRIEEMEKTLKNKERIMSMMAHSLGAPLSVLEHNAKTENNKEVSLRAIRIISNFRSMISLLSSDTQRLRELFQQDKQGNLTLLTMLTQSIVAVLSEIIYSSQSDTLIHYHLAQLKKEKRIAESVERQELYDNSSYLVLWDKIKREWRDSFVALNTENAPFENYLQWIESHLFKLEIVGFDTFPIRSKEDGTKKTIFMMIFQQLFSNIIKYSDTPALQPVTIEWKREGSYYLLQCKNISLTEYEYAKGSKRGVDFVQMLVDSLAGEFSAKNNTGEYCTCIKFPTVYFD